MKKLIYLSAIALLIFATVGCEDKTETPKEKYFDCQIYRPIYKILHEEPVFIKYSEHYGVFVIMIDDPNQKTPTPLVPCGNSLPKEYQIDGLKVKVSGVCRNCTSKGAPNIRMSFLYKINIKSIKLNTK